MNPLLWLMIALFFVFLESISAGLICIWFAIGAAFSWIGALFGANLLVQLLLFFPGSLVVMLLFRKCLVGKEKKQEQKTNADSLIGKVAVVTEAINNINETGEVKIEGKRWSARGKYSACEFRVGDQVQIVAIQGVKLIVQQPSTLKK